MANINLSNLKLPDLSNADFDNKAVIRQLCDYMFKLQEQLSFVLSQLDESNLSSELKQAISASNASESSGISAEAEDELAGMKTSIAQNASAIMLKASQSSVDALGNRVTGAEASISANATGIAAKVSKGSVISEINQSAEQVKITAGKIALEGMVTANGGFKVYDGVAASPITGQIPVSGWLEVTGGRVGCFLMADGGTRVEWGKTLQVGQMIMGYDRILSMNYAPSLILSQRQLCMDSHSRWDIINEDGTHVRADFGDGRGEQYLYAQPASLTGFYTSLPGVPSNPGT